MWFCLCCVHMGVCLRCSCPLHREEAGESEEEEEGEDTIGEEAVVGLSKLAAREGVCVFLVSCFCVPAFRMPFFSHAACEEFSS